MRSKPRYLCVSALLLALTSFAQPLRAETPESPEAWLHLAVERLCGPDAPPSLAAETLLPGTWFLDEERREPGGNLLRLEQRFALPGDGELRITRFQPGGVLRRFTAAYYEVVDDQPRPRLQALADGGCEIRSGRRIRTTAAGGKALDQLEGDLTTLRWSETLEAPWPAGSDPGGPRVALVDSGLAYDLPHFRDRLARDAAGRPLGYDFWDLDPHPYDGDTARGDFLPIRHGSAVASVLAQEAPTATLIPFRYPRPDMGRMGDLVRAAAAAGARILAMPLGSNNPDDWTAFADAMKAQPELLAIVSAGNNGRNIDAEPLWPAALRLENLVVVTSADDFGRLAPGSNWGPESVHIMLPAENQQVIDFRGAKGTASGSSYAVPRLAALTARLLAADPDLSTADLKAAIFARATASPYEDKVVAIGWIPDPARP